MTEPFAKPCETGEEYDPMSGILRVAVVLGFVLALAAPAAAEERPLPRIAAAQIGEFHVARSLGELGPDVVVRAAAQGARDACLGPDGKPRPATTCDRPADNAPAGVCVDATIYRALGPLAECESGDRAPDAIELHSPCRTTECVTADAKEAGASHVLVVQGKSTEYGIDVALDLITLSSGKVRSKRYRDYFPEGARNDAEIVPRTGPQIVAIVHGMARDLVGEVIVAAPEAATAPRAPVLVTTPSPDSERRPLPRWIGWALASVGVAAIAAGAYAWHIDSTRQHGCVPTTDVNCPDLWDTKWKLALPLIAGGTAATGLGGWLIYRSSHGEVAASVAVGGVGVRGRF
jgi:hypothetical protein